MHFRIVWPEERFISEQQIRLWYADAITNGEAEKTNLQRTDEMARELDNIGQITLAQGNI